MTSHATYPVAEVQGLYRDLAGLRLQYHDACEALQQVREEYAQAMQRISEQDAALAAIAAAGGLIADLANKSITADAFDSCVRDLAPWTNIMAAHGMKRDGTPIKKRSKK